MLFETLDQNLPQAIKTINAIRVIGYQGIQGNQGNQDNQDNQGNQCNLGNQGNLKLINHEAKTSVLSDLPSLSGDLVHTGNNYGMDSF